VSLKLVMSLEVFPIKATKKEGKFDLYNEIKKLVKKNSVSLKEGDILVISSKYISNSQGRILDHSSIKLSEKANELSRKFSINQKLSEAIVREVFLGLLSHHQIILWHPMLVLTNQILKVN